MFFIISILPQVIASPPLTVSDAGVTVKETGRPQPEQTLFWKDRALGKKQHCRLTLLITNFLNEVISSSPFSE